MFSQQNRTTRTLKHVNPSEARPRNRLICKSTQQSLKTRSNLTLRQSRRKTVGAHDKEPSMATNDGPAIHRLKFSFEPSISTSRSR